MLSRIDYFLLFLDHKFKSFLQAVGLTLNANVGAVIQDAIQDGRNNGDVGKDLIPLGEGLVGGKNGGGFLIPPGNELEEQVCALNIHGKIADPIDDEHSVLGQYFELVQQAVLKMSLFSCSMSW